MRLLLVFILILGFYLWMKEKTPAFEEAGLEQAMLQLEVGKHVSPQYFAQLVATLQRASLAYGKSLQGNGLTALNELRLETVKANAAAQELVYRAPSDRIIEQKLQKGKELMMGQLIAWVADVKARWKLKPAPGDSEHFWNRYYEL